MQMGYFTYLTIEFLPLLTLVMLYATSRMHLTRMPHAKTFQILVMFVAFTLVIDSFCWYTLARPESFPVEILWFSNITYFVCSQIISYIWFVYVAKIVYGEFSTRAVTNFVKFSVIPLVLICILILLCPIMGSIFYIDVDGSYHRGSLYFLQVIVGFLYLVAAACISFMRVRKEFLLEVRQQYGYITIGVLLPLLGGSIQTLNYNLILLWPLTVAGLFLVYTVYKKNQISTDPLTGLNNRGSVEKYLKWRHSQNEGTWYLMFIDMNDFKIINDKYGHIQGDNTLRLLASTLKSMLGPLGAFIARYGGDEFALIIEASEDSEMDQIIESLASELRRISKDEELEYEPSFSAGYCKYYKDCGIPLNELIITADSNMYLHKRKSKESRLKRQQKAQ